MPSPGNFVFVVGDEEAKAYLRDGDRHVGSMVTDIVNDIAEHAADELRFLAPGRIGAELVDVEKAHSPEPGIVQAVAGVLPDLTDEAMFGPVRGLTSDPAHYPVFVDVGTGVHGERGRPIVTIPGNVMVFSIGDHKIFTHTVKGQKAQHYSDRAWLNTIYWTPTRIARGRLPSGGT